MKTLFPFDQQKESPHQQLAPLLFPPSTAAESWKLIATELKNKISPNSYSRWIKPIQHRETRKNEITLYVPNLFFSQNLTNDYWDKIEACKKELGLNNLIIKVCINPFDKNKTENEQGQTAKKSTSSSFLLEQAPSKTSVQKTAKSSDLLSKTVDKATKLNPLYSFESFVQGPSNQFALASCRNVAENPGLHYNPLFLYGSTGLGKTHLLQAVGNFFLKQHPKCLVTYITSERFMNELIYCIRHSKMWNFRQKYRQCDVFMMDDIQFISGNKSATQEEFFHTFNSLYENKKQIIMTSDLFPQEIPDIEERLRNRFQWGLIADIQPPDKEHRIAILLSKAKQLKITLDYKVAEYIAERAKKNIRELEGALHRIAAFSALQGHPIDKSIAMETFGNVLSEPAGKIPIESILKIVADYFKVKPQELRSKRRLKILTMPRQIAMYLARKYTKASYPEIGEKFGGKDHTTIMHAVKKISEQRKKDLDLKAHIETLLRTIESQE